MSTQLSPRVRDAIAALLWLPLLLILWAAALSLSIAAVGISWSLATSGTVPDLSGLSGAVDPTLIAGASLAGIAYVYLTLLTETFGEDTVDAATEQAQEIRGEVQEAREGQE